MSQIFDALLRSEAERGGEGTAAEVEATELLRYVEREAATKLASGTVLNGFESPAAGIRQAVLDPVDVYSQAEAFETRMASRDTSDDHGDIWSRFQKRTAACSSEGRLVCYTDRATPTAEAFRLLGVRLRELRQTRPLNKLLITSTVPREGKSTMASNLACALAQKKEEKVLLLEGDIRRPTLSGIFNLGQTPGICQLLQDGRSLIDSVYHLEGAGIWIMPAGTTPATPLELLQSKKLPALMEQLGKLFDWVIVDSPPILPLADTSIWSQMVDGILLVTRHGTTEKRQLERGLHALEASKVIGALLNGSQASTYSSYYYTSSADSKRAAS
ncbi:MAG TPA: CpsD/CapB family tyrosine-protein kinase [Terracidiphilus sp.]|jgi:capsular exopolysaccharide synthesis family protein|nr:CpsD/CapB family tyrosine-protein kinase [Terracidiphilus sp.]